MTRYMALTVVAVLGCCHAALGEETRLEDPGNFDLVENPNHQAHRNPAS